MSTAREKYELVRSTLQEEDNVLTTQELCEIAGVSRSGYYNWCKTEQCRQDREIRDQEDFALIVAAFGYRGYNKGVRGIHMRLLHMGIVMNVKKIRRLMRKYGLFCPIRKANPYRRMAKAMRTNNVAPNLVNREFEEHGPRSILEQLQQFVSTMIDYYETEHYVFVHGWPPTEFGDGGEQIMEHWRYASNEEWSHARWSEWPSCYAKKLILPHKIIVCGHRCTRYGDRYDLKRTPIDDSIFYGEGMIALDAGTIRSKKINVLVVDEEVD